MKNRASAFLKQIICLLGSIAKSMAIKNKTSAAIVPYNINDDAADIGVTAEPHSTHQLLLENSNDDDDDRYSDLILSLFDESEDEGGSIIDLVRNSKEEGEDFSLEEEIDLVADLFIKRFYKQMRLQKLESFKRFQEMLARGL